MDIGGSTQRTTETLSDDGTYGKSAEYFFWFDSRDRYWQFPNSGGALMLICDAPVRFPKIIHNFEMLAGDVPKAEKGG